MSQEIKVKVSEREKKDIQKLAILLGMSCSSLCAVMIYDTIHEGIADILGRKEKFSYKGKKKNSDERTEKENVNSPKNKSQIISVRVEEEYVESIIRITENREDMKHYLSEIAGVCIAHQMQFLKNLLDTETEKNHLEIYIEEKSKIIGVGKKGIKNYFIAKYISNYIEEYESEKKAWKAPMNTKEYFK